MKTVTKAAIGCVSSLLGLALILLATGVVLFHSSHVSPDEARKFLDEHRDRLNDMVALVDGLPSLGFVTHFSTNDYRILVERTDSLPIYFTASYPKSAGEIWDQKFESLVDKQLAMTLSQLLARADIPMGEFVAICKSLRELDMYSISEHYPGRDIRFNLKEVSGLTYCHNPIRYLESSVYEKREQIDEHWYWFWGDD